jgi:hypothetical protein
VQDVEILAMGFLWSEGTFSTFAVSWGRGIQRRTATASRMLSIDLQYLGPNGIERSDSSFETVSQCCPRLSVHSRGSSS